MALTRERRRTILILALPIIGGMISQNVLNLVDTAMVGALGNEALGAVGFGGFANFIAIAFITGLATGVQAMVARRHGEERHDESAVPLNGGLMLSLLIGLPVSLLFAALAPTVFPLITSDAEVGRLAGDYLQIRVLSAVFIGANFAFRGYWNGVSRSGVYFRTIVVMHALNILLNWLLIHGNLGMPALGVRGAALGTAIANAVGCMLYAVQAFVLARDGGFLRALPDRATLATMLRLAGPAGLQSFFFAGGMFCFFWIVEQMGTAEVAATNVLVNLFLVFILPGMAFGLASASLVGQSLGRGNAGEARGWALDVATLGGATMGSLALLGALVPDALLTPFLHDPEVVALARWPLRILLLGIVVDTVGSVMMNSLLGAGDARTVMAVAVTMQWFVFLPVAFLVGPVLGLGLVSVWIAQSVYRLIQTTIFVTIWRRGRWSRIRV